MMGNEIAKMRGLARLGLAGGVLAALSLSSPALADEHTAGTMESRGERYNVAVAMQPEPPVVGLVHFTVRPLDVGTSAPAVGARIELVAHDPEGRPAFRAPAISTPDDRSRYDANITFPSPGDWTLVVNVRDEVLGEESFSFELPLAETSLRSGLAGTLVWLLTFAALVGGGGYITYRSRQLRATTKHPQR